MIVADTELADVKLLEPRVFADERGEFLESWNERTFAAEVADVKFVQDNQSISVRYALRGLHYQIKQAQGKLVRVVRGEVFDAVVDLRRSSPEFGRSAGVILSAENNLQLWVPPGFAHGFLALSDDAVLLYKCTDYYAPEFERTIIWNDPEIGIEWPLPAGSAPLLSPKDQRGRSLGEADCFE